MYEEAMMNDEGQPILRRARLTEEQANRFWERAGGKASRDLPTDNF
jgi:hypothetical protein